MSNMIEKYVLVAKAAMSDGITSGNQTLLTAWIIENCKVSDKDLFFVVLGVGVELANLEAQALGFDNEAHRAFTLATESAAIMNGLV